RVLPLLVLRRPRLRSHRARRHLRSRLPADVGSAVVRNPAAPEQDLAYQHHRTLMATKLETLAGAVQAAGGDALKSLVTDRGEMTAVVGAGALLAFMRELRDRPELRFDMLIDVCGVDYQAYGQGAWEGARFAAVYHLLSLPHNRRLRV